jgi:transcriptional repressor NrdR
MLCPTCKSDDNQVIDSRVTEAGAAIRRRRVCRSCQRRFTTKERVEEEMRLSVIKANGQRAPYQREKILHGLELACSKLNVTDAQIAQVVDRVEEDVFANHEREVNSEEIGRCVGKHLRRLNQAAYVRFMSVHRKFSTVDEFIEEIMEVRARAAGDHPAQQSLFEV